MNAHIDMPRDDLYSVFPPFEVGKYKVTIVDDRGIESLKIVEIE